MGRKPNDNRGRLGGRAKGTKNKRDLNTWAAKLIEGNRDQIERDLEALTPAERIGAVCDIVDAVARIAEIKPGEGAKKCE